MAENTAISWCDHTFNGWIGCLKVSPACNGCYAEAMMDKRYGRVTWGAPGQGAGTRVRTSESNWKQPLKWNRKAAETGTRPFVFCASLADVFDNQVPTEWRRDLFDLIARTPNLVWLLLTKRPQLIVRLTQEAGGLPRNVALGTTTEDRQRWRMNVGELGMAKFVLRPLFTFVSIEPMLEGIYLREAPIPESMKHLGIVDKSQEYFDPLHPSIRTLAGIDWVIAGGETDQGTHKARPMRLAWVRELRDECAKAGVPFHFKQWGEYAPDDHAPDADRTVMRRVGKKTAGRLLDGVEHNDRPRV